MKKVMSGLVAALVAGMAVGAPVYTVALPTGVTNTLAEAFANAYVTSEPAEDVSYEGLCAAADLRIAGAGRLEINQDLKSAGYTGEVHVVAGAILRITANGALGDIDHGTFVADGATLENECLDTSDNSKLDFAKEHLTFAGTGVDGLGALVARTPSKQERNGVWGGTYLTMTGDATISTVNGYQDFPNNSSANSLNMNGHTLTVRGFDTATGATPGGVCLRPVVTNPGHIVITNCGASINSLADLGGGAENTFTLANRGRLELYDCPGSGKKKWTLVVSENAEKNSLTSSSNGGCWDGPIVVQRDGLQPYLNSQKNDNGTTNVNHSVFAGKISVKGPFSISNGMGAVRPSLTLSSSENDFKGIVEVGTSVTLKLPVDGALSCTTAVVYKAAAVELDPAVTYERLPIMTFKDSATVTGGAAGTCAGAVKNGAGDVSWDSGVGFRTLDLNEGRLSLDRILPDQTFYAGLSYGFDTNFNGWSKTPVVPGERYANSAFYTDNIATVTNKVALDFSDVRMTATQRSLPGGSATYYDGYIINPGTEDVTWRFAICMKYLAWVKVNGTKVISRQETDSIAYGNATLKPGANHLVIHSGSNGDCYTYVPKNNANWTNGWAFAVCKTSLTSEDPADFEPLADPGDGSVLRCALENTTHWTELGEAWSNEYFSVERLTAAAGTTLGLGNRRLHAARLEGVTTIEGRTGGTFRQPGLTVTDTWSVSGADLAAGKKLSCGPELTFADGAQLEIVGGKALRKNGKVTIAESDLPIVGLPTVVSTDGSVFELSKSADGKTLYAEFQHPGLLLFIR